MLLWEQVSKQKWINPENLANKVLEIRALGKKITTLNGSFDLLHAGHLQILYEASQTADVLIVALNTDDSIKGYKGPDRPLVSLENRLQMISALGFVDFVTWFSEANPLKLLEVIKPDVHVNGAEYGENCIEADVVKQNGGRIHIVQLIPGLSTSKLLARIRSSQT